MYVCTYVYIVLLMPEMRNISDEQVSLVAGVCS